MAEQLVGGIAVVFAPDRYFGKNLLVFDGKAGPAALCFPAGIRGRCAAGGTDPLRYCGIADGAGFRQEFARKLEQYYLANREAGDEVRYGILADLPDSSKPMGPEEQDWVDRARTAVSQLNRRYPGQFYLFFRCPQYQSREERYLGWERKRGALLELARFLRAVPGGLKLLEGERSALAGTRYLLTLDSDTTLNVDAARRLIGAMLHPMNQPKIDEKKKIVTSGYGILQPRTAVSLTDAGKTRFARHYGGPGWGGSVWMCL